MKTQIKEFYDKPAKVTVIPPTLDVTFEVEFNPNDTEKLIPTSQ
jgi:predicted RNA-binding protein YlqC (UPF0109 family)